MDNKEIIKAVVGAVAAVGCLSAYVDISAKSMREGTGDYSLKESFDSLAVWQKASIGVFVVGLGYIIVKEVVLKK